jgi:hypothetical protein
VAEKAQVPYALTRIDAHRNSALTFLKALDRRAIYRLYEEGRLDVVGLILEELTSVEGDLRLCARLAGVVPGQFGGRRLGPSGNGHSPNNRKALAKA